MGMILVADPRKQFEVRPAVFVRVLHSNLRKDARHRVCTDGTFAGATAPSRPAGSRWLVVLAACRLKQPGAGHLLHPDGQAMSPPPP